MKLRSPRIFLAAGAVLLAGVVWLFLGNPPPTSQRLADGSTVSLLGVSYGRKHVLLPRPVWHRAIARLLPEKAARRIGIYTVTHTTTNDTLMVWTELRDLSSLANQMPYIPVTLSDGQNTEIVQLSPQVMWGATNCMIQGTLFSVVPRGSNQLRVVVGPLNRTDEAKQSVVFSLPNPVQRHRPVWQAPPLPIEATSGDLKFVLTRLKPWARHDLQGSRTITETWMSAGYRFEEAGVTTTNWRVAKVEIFDEAGGRYQPFNYSSGFDLTRKEFEFRGGLGTNAVWKLRFTLSRTSGFGSNEIASIPRLTMPSRGLGPSEPIALSAGGMNLSVHGEFNQDGAKIVARLAASDEDVQLMILQMVDGYGANIGHYPYANQFKGNYSWPLHPRQESDHINVTLALSRLRYVELLVRPEPPFKYSPSTFPATGK